MTGARTTATRVRVLLHSLVLWLRRRTDVPPGSVAIGYGRDARLTGWALFAVSAVETAAVHMLVPWDAVRAVLLLAGVVATVLLLASLADTAVRPHLLTGDVLRLRAGSALAVDVPLVAIASVARRRAETARPVGLADGVLVLGSGGQTDVELVLAAPLHLAAGRHVGEVTTVRFAADVPAATVNAVQQRRTTPA